MESSLQKTDNTLGHAFSEHTKLLGLSLQTCTELAKSIHFDKSHKWHFGLVTLYGSILELSHSICILTKNDSPIGIPILLRSLLEAAIDFNNLSNDKKYGYNMDAALLHQWILVLEEAQKNSNPFLSTLSTLPDLPSQLETYRKKLSTLKSNGYKVLSQSEKFKISNMTFDYKSIYNFLCCETHNNARTLYSRHAKLSEDSLDFEVEFFSEIDPADTLPYIDSTLGILLSTSETIHQKLETGFSVNLAPLSEHLKNLRKQWLA